MDKEIFEISKTFLKKKYSPVDQIRRPSRSVPANIAEACVKWKYPKSFKSKLLDSFAEEGETEVWIDKSEAVNKLMLNYIIHSWKDIRKLHGCFIQ